MFRNYKKEYTAMIGERDNVAAIARARELQIAQLTDKLEASKAQVLELTEKHKAELMDLFGELEGWKQANEELARQLEASRAHALEEFNARSELQAVVDELRQDLKEAREREDNQRDRHREAIEERDDLKIRLQSACEAMTASEERAQELQADNNNARAQLEAYEAQLQAVEKDRDEQIGRLRAENEELRNIIRHYESSVATTRNQHEDHIKELDATLGKVQDERDRAEENVRVLEVRLKEVAAERDEAKKAVEDMKARFADRREKHTIEVNALVAERNQAKEAMEGAVKDTTYWRHCFEDAQEDRETARAKCEALAEKLMAVEAERDLLKGDLEAVMAERKSGNVRSEARPEPAGNAPKEGERPVLILKVIYGLKP